jgi:putrescine transport system substrate-binding protein
VALGTFWLVFILGVLGAVWAARARDEKLLNPLFFGKTINVVVWRDQIPQDVLATFKRDTGITVHLVHVGTNDSLKSLLLAHPTGFDLAMPSAFMAENLKDLSDGPNDKPLLRKFTEGALPHLKNIDREFNPEFDPDNEWTVPYTWSAFGIAYNSDKIGRFLRYWTDIFPISDDDIRHDETAAPKVLEDLIQDSTPRRRVALLDDAHFILGSVVLARHSTSKDITAHANDDEEGHVEFNLDNVTKKDVADAGAFLRRHAGRILLIQNGDASLDYALRKQVDIAISWSCDATTVMLGSKEKEPYIERNLKIRFAVPEEGTIVSRTCFVLPADALHPGEAHQFLDYLMRPDVAGRVTSYCRSATTVIGASAFVDSRILNSPAYFKHPTPAKNFYIREVDPDIVLHAGSPDSLATDIDYDITWESVRRAVGPLSHQEESR